MNIFLQYVLPALITLLLSGILIPVSTRIVSRHMTKYFDNKDKAKEEQETEKHRLQALEKQEAEKKLVETIDNVVKTHTDPIDEELERINSKLSKVEAGTLDTLRDRILTVYYKCLGKGYRSEYDIDNVKHMYHDYLALDGNSFVGDCMEKFRQIPTEKEYEILNKKTKTRKSRSSAPRAKKEDKEE